MGLLCVSTNKYLEQPTYSEQLIGFYVTFLKMVAMSNQHIKILKKIFSEVNRKKVAVTSNLAVTRSLFKLFSHE